MEENRSELGTIFHKEKDYNCAQSVLCAFSDLTGIDKSTALAVADGLGGGVRCGEVCGALTGAVMAAGAICRKNGQVLARSPRTKKLTLEITRRFKEKEGYLRCRDLLESTEQRMCDKYIADAIDILEEILEEEENDTVR